jgi:hypothetical protein
LRRHGPRRELYLAIVTSGHEHFSGAALSGFTLAILEVVGGVTGAMDSVLEPADRLAFANLVFELIDRNLYIVELIGDRVDLAGLVVLF